MYNISWLCLYIPSSHGFSWYLWFRSILYLYTCINVLKLKEGLRLQFFFIFTHICNFSPYIKTISTHKSFAFCLEEHRIFYIADQYHIFLFFVVHMCIQKSVIYDNRLKLKTYKFSSVKTSQSLINKCSCRNERFRVKINSFIKTLMNIPREWMCSILV